MTISGTSMLAPDDYKAVFVDPAIEQFCSTPTSLLHACTVIWCLDALASHVALAQTAKNIHENPKLRGKVEQQFKDEIVQSGEEGAWQFHVVREASNALKHGWRRTTLLGAETSDVLRVEAIDGMLHYCHGPRRAPRSGEQVVCTLDLEFDEQRNCFVDSDGGDFVGLFTRWIPVLGLVVPTLGLIGFDTELTEKQVGSDW
jgi:hypothetical protein